MSQSYLTAVNARSAWLNSSAPRPYPAYRSRPASNAPAPPCTRRCPTARNSPDGELTALTRRCFALRAKRGLCGAGRGVALQRLRGFGLVVHGAPLAAFPRVLPSFPLAGEIRSGAGKAARVGLITAAARRHGALPRDPAAFEKAGETFTCLRREQLRDFCS